MNDNPSTFIGWMDGWMDECMHGWMVGWMNACMHACMHAFMGEIFHIKDNIFVKSSFKKKQQKIPHTELLLLGLII